MHVESFSDRGAHLILNAEYVSQIPVKTIRPQVESILYSDQAGCNAKLVSRSPDRSLQHRLYAQFPANLSDIARWCPSIEIQHWAR